MEFVRTDTGNVSCV